MRSVESPRGRRIIAAATVFIALTGCERQPPPVPIPTWSTTAEPAPSNTMPSPTTEVKPPKHEKGFYPQLEELQNDVRWFIQQRSNNPQEFDEFEQTPDGAQAFIPAENLPDPQDPSDLVLRTYIVGFTKEFPGTDAPLNTITVGEYIGENIKDNNFPVREYHVTIDDDGTIRFGSRNYNPKEARFEVWTSSSHPKPGEPPFDPEALQSHINAMNGLFGEAQAAKYPG